MDQLKYIDTEWDFKNDDTKISTHGFHSYPAMMIPQIARRLIETYGQKSKVLLDPFMGTGTALVEAKINENFKQAYGVDINPLTRLISKVKTTPINEKILYEQIIILLNCCHEVKTEVIFNNYPIKLPAFQNINFWFKNNVIVDLAIVKHCIDNISLENKQLEKDIKDFCLVVFSEIVRKVSNTRNSEFKLYRMAEAALSKHNSDVLLEFENKLRFNYSQLINFNSQAYDCEIKILPEDSRFETSIPSNSVDIIVTSPPYGDSRTTVAYGQFSRLSLEWLGFESKEARSIDKKSLGGIPPKELEHLLKSPSLNDSLNLISTQDEKRAKDVLGFYLDFNKCVVEFDRVMKKGGFLCFVVGNRTVKGVKIPTDEIIVDLFKDIGNYEHHKTIIRNIPNKRMPKKNSPTNVKGALKSTMNEEYIVILEKI